MTIIDRRFSELTAGEFHDIAKLRVDVFVVEQQCVYAEIDGRDAAPSTRHVWVGDGHGLVAYLRILEAAEATCIGRVVTRRDARSQGHAGLLMDYALAHSDGPWTLEAQAHLADWYALRGFEAVGEEYLWDGIVHVPMARGAQSQAPPGRSRT